MMRGRGINKIPPFYAWFMRNMRIKDGVVVQKQWSDFLFTAGAEIQAMLRYPLQNRLLFVAWGSLYHGTSSATLIWAVGSYTSEYTMFAYGDYVLILNGKEPIRIYHSLYGLYRSDSGAWYQGGAWVQPPGLNDGISSIVAPNALIGTKITGFTLIAWNNSVTKKTVYISKPITPDTPYNCFNFSITAGQDYDIWENRYMDSNILAMASTNDNAYIFTEESIEVLGRDTVSVSWGIATLSSRKIAWSDQIANRNLVAVVWEKAFFVTKSKKIMAINYTQWLEFPLLDTELSASINDWLQLNMDNSQDKAFAYYDKQENHVEFHLVKEWGTSSTVPDLVVIYDLKSQSFYPDDDIGFQCLIRGWTSGNTTYCANGASIYIDNAWTTWDNRRQDTSSNTVAINAQYNTPNIALGTAEEKLFRWFIVRGGIDQNCSMQFDCYIDWTLEFTKTIIDNNIPTAQKEVVNTWDPTSYATSQKIYPFEMVCDQGMLRKKGKRIRIQITCTSTSINKFFLDELRIDALGTGNYELSDKF